MRSCVRNNKPVIFPKKSRNSLCVSGDLKEVWDMIVPVIVYFLKSPHQITFFPWRVYMASRDYIIL